jgi:hypothetical protein
MSPNKRSSAPVALSAGQAQYVLERLARERVVSRAEISRYVSDMAREIAELEARLYRLREAAGDGAGAGGNSVPSAAPPRRSRGRRPDSSAGLDAKRLGGRFAGLIRRLPDKDRGQYHEIKSTKGVEAAIKALQNRQRD